MSGPTEDPFDDGPPRFVVIARCVAAWPDTSTAEVRTHWRGQADPPADYLESILELAERSYRGVFGVDIEPVRRAVVVLPYSDDEATP